MKKIKSFNGRDHQEARLYAKGILREQKNATDLLHKYDSSFLLMPSGYKSVISILADWLLIIASVCAANTSIWNLPLALLIIGSRQRALSNLVHDGAHGNLFRSKYWNDLATNFFAAYPMLDNVKLYRKIHFSHHAFLGHNLLDPDSLSHEAIGYHKKMPIFKNSFKRYFYLIFNKESWLQSVVGGLRGLKGFDCVKIFFLFLFLVMIEIYFGSLKLAFLTIGCWFGARLSTYHCVRIFAEFLDHTGLKPGSIIGFSRSLSGVSPPACWIFHPNQDTFHLAHHLLPAVPHYNLKLAHKILLNSCEKYKNGHHCDSYFFGNSSAWGSWNNPILTTEGYL